MNVSSILLVIALPIIVVGLGMAFYQHWSISHGAVVQGTVIENVARGKSGSSKYSPRIQFTTKQGKEVVFMTTFSSNPPAYDKGETVTVVYAGEGEDARILSFALRFGLAWALMGAALALIILAIGFKYGDQVVRSLYIRPL